MSHTVQFYASLGFPDVEIAKTLAIPLGEVRKQLAGLSGEELSEAEEARRKRAKEENPRERWFHGDTAENMRAGGRVQSYCSLCDAFVDDEAHFQQHTRKQNIGRFRFDLRVFAFEASQGPVIRCGHPDDNVIERTMIAESDASCAEFLK